MDYKYVPAVPQTQYIMLKPKNLVALNNMGCIKEAQQSSLLMNFEQMQWNKVFYRMYVLAVIEVMSLSGHLSNINKISTCPDLSSWSNLIT